jgi:hypothetical protein
MLKIKVETNISFLITYAGTGPLCRVARHVNGILGLLCKTHFPGLVDYAKKREPAYTFDHYANAIDAEAENKAV